MHLKRNFLSSVGTYFNYDIKFITKLSRFFYANVQEEKWLSNDVQIENEAVKPVDFSFYSILKKKNNK